MINIMVANMHYKNLLNEQQWLTDPLLMCKLKILQTRKEMVDII